ncbi:RagB/SusD family nutrient uptake outer membrane protein [Flavobacterium branchiicola]|uniref:RagB/SusD family nutrient uptake outer membrane protein n=1 Tax=Flavobacterium branchiicola TaxID=1114875 RepID=A0ABV9PCY3_9FLAO|nr:RagB/SusD family nutrient uptake outer membrane protein [Flavobacterium branchiicola]MBS7254202.1 RagB/SusD family nutrient uptake outer membrane protein [Flavobacterium branchiicola]
MKYLKYITIAILIFSAQSCSDFLEQEPGTQTSIDELLQNKQGILTALKGLYTSVEENVRGERFAAYADLQGGNLKITPFESTNKGEIVIPTAFAKVYSFEDQSDISEFKSFYDTNYDNINQANLLLEYVPKLTDATEVEKNQIIAEALTIRAYSHFLLSLVFSQNYSYTPDASHLGIVYTTSSIKSGVKYPARETVANTYSLIIKDLKTALDNYGTNSGLEGPAYSYFNSNNTKALLARVYLYKKDWQNAYDTANDVITNSGVTLMNSSDLIAQWEKTDLPVSEILLEFSTPRDATGTTSSSVAAYFGYTTSPPPANTITNTGRKYVASNDLLDLYETNDLRKKLFLPLQLSTLIAGNQVPMPYNFTKKYHDNPGYVAFRLSELYLIRAEAAAETNKPDLAMADVNIIRARANASLLTNSSNIKEDILLERRKELCFEGHLFFDLVRNQKGITRNDGCISSVCSLNYPSPKFILPIPLYNTNLNSNLKQNESY